MVVIDSETISVNTKSYKPVNNNNLVIEALKSDEKIEENLHVISVISNICNFKRRYELMNKFIENCKNYYNVILYIVELAYGQQEFKITDSNNPRHLQLRTNKAIWHKESMINVGISKLLPNDWKAVCILDGDIEFENPNWANDTLKILTKFNIVQPFTCCFDLNQNEIPMSIWQSFG